ncbi:MAG TPA: ABC transporter permease subunit, partial [Limnochordia bacterium]
MSVVLPTWRRPVGWVRQNLFNSWLNAFLTIAVGWLLIVVLTRALAWAFTRAEWEIIPANFRLFMVGTYPASELWRPWLCLLLLALLGGATAAAWGGAVRRFVTGQAIAACALALIVTGQSRLWLIGCVAAALIGYASLRRVGRAKRRHLVVAWVLSFPLMLLLLRGFEGSDVLPTVSTSQWGGLLLTLVLAAVGIVASLPIGIVLALGRRSRLGAIRWVCIAYIELIRGLPLISVLFMAQIMVPIFLPDFRIDKVLRAMIGFTLFTAAYMAENVRGGLQGVPKGQYEAAAAIGLNGAQATFLIILPQALRAVIPAI